MFKIEKASLHVKLDRCFKILTLNSSNYELKKIPNILFLVKTIPFKKNETLVRNSQLENRNPLSKNFTRPLQTKKTFANSPN